MGRIAEVSLGDIVRAGGRYRPVAVTVAAVMAIVWAFPAPAGLDQAAGPPAQPPLAQAGQGQVTTDEQAAAPEPPEPPASQFEMSGPATYEEPAFAEETYHAPPAETYSPPPAEESARSASAYGEATGAEPEEPLVVVGSAWASQGAGTPIATMGVPEDTLPVGTRLGSEDKVSFIRLSGNASELSLTEDPEGARDMAGDPAVQICKVLDSGWQEEEAMSFDDAPEWDPDSCVDGERAEDGTWTFALLALGDPTDDAGFALVPGEEAPVDFQVAFKTSATPSY